MGWIVAVDTGGTFTDFAAFEQETGTIRITKSLTNYDSFVEGVMECVEKAEINLGEADVVKLGTTLVINTFVQRNGAKTALITTRGFRDVLELRRGNRKVPFDLRFRPSPVLVDRDLRFEVTERIASDGSVLEPLRLDELDELIDLLDRVDVQAVAVSFINAYTNMQHEEVTAETIRKKLPGVFVTTGTELVKEWYEYERTSTAVANAYVGPRMEQYVKGLHARLSSEGFTKTFFLMASNGGVFSVERAARQPVMMVESGPVGGCIGAAAYARALGLEKAIAFDMGGTTAKCALINGGSFDVKSPYVVGDPDRGFPVQGAVVDIVEVGAGGGSIAYVDAQHRLHVGPRSAGSSPGPVAYGRGGTEPTITDANIVLGRIGAASFLGGEMKIDAKAAELSLAKSVASPLGYSGASGLDRAAQGVVDLGTVRMAGAIRQITVERGLDPRDFVLFPFGGGGPLHGTTLAREMNIPRVVVPPHPGIFSALGMLLADARVDETVTFVHTLDEEGVAAMASRFASLERQVTEAMKREIGERAIHFERNIEMRYRGQKQALRFSLPFGADMSDIRSAFENAYRTRFGHADTAGPLEFVNLLLTAFAALDQPNLESLAQLGPASSTSGTRSVYFPESGTRLLTPVFSRESLPRGFSAAGPALIEEYGSTTVVGPNDHFSIGSLGEISIEIGL